MRARNVVMVPGRYLFKLTTLSSRGGRSLPAEGSMESLAAAALPAKCIDPSARKKRGPLDDRVVGWAHRADKHRLTMNHDQREIIIFKECVSASCVEPVD